jgi:hypothetical protein
MAKRDDTDTKIPTPSDKDFVREAIERFEEADTHASEQRKKAVEDYKFALVPGHQWDQHLTAKRRRRPCYEFNRQRQMIRRVTGQQLQNRPQINVRPAEDGDVDTAEIYNGIIRAIQNSSDSKAKIAYDSGFTWACAGGVGAWQVTTAYANDEVEEGQSYGADAAARQLKPNSFDKVLRIDPIEDPFTVTFDPAARDFHRIDARYCFVSELISRSEFKRLYPGKQLVDFTATGSTALDKDWWYEDTVRIAKYWYKEVEKRVIYLLNDGTVVDATDFDPIADEAAAEGITIADTREIDRQIVKCCLISGRDKLTKPVEWPGKYFPVVLNWGELLTVDGKQYYSGMTRFGRDAQMIHNFELSTLIEIVAKMPNSPLTATPKMIEGLKSYYERLGYDDPPVLLYNVDPSSPAARPTREPAAQFPAAFANVSALAVDEIKATMGIYDASLGAQSNETSGRAILARKQEGDISNYVYVDNHLKALEFTGAILVDLIPKVYDATRTLRILGEDGKAKFVKVNRPIRDMQTGEVKIINDLSRGKYDVVVSTGKSFETQRMEVAEAAEAMARTPGPFGMLAQYLLFRNLDVPGMDEFLAACRKVLVKEGLLEPGEKDPPQPPPQPDPKIVADVELKGAQARKTDAQTQQIVALTPAQVEKTRAQTAESIERIAEGLPTVPIGPSIFGPAPGTPAPGAPSQ